MELNLTPTYSASTEENTYFFCPAIPICLALMGGICMGNWFSGGGVWALGAILLGMALSLRWIRLERPAKMVPLGLLFAAGYLALQPYTAPILSESHVTQFDDGQTHIITGRISSLLEISADRQKLNFTTESIHSDGLTQRVSGELRLTIYGDTKPLHRGDRIRFEGRIKQIRNFFNPGGFDYQRFMAFKGIRASAYGRSDTVVLLDRRMNRGLPWFIGRHRDEIARLIIDAAPENRDTQAILTALLIGRKEMISDELRARFNACGLGHLLAISGLHVGMVAMVAFAFFRTIFRSITPLLWRGTGDRFSAGLALIPVIYYGWLAGFPPSTQRAAIMVTILLGTYLVGRKGEIINTLAWAAILVLILHPPTLFSISFQLSFSAVLAIIIGMRHCDWRLVTTGHAIPVRLANWILQIFLVSVFALLGTLPLSMYYFNQISVIGPLANVVIVPMIGMISIPLGLLAIFVNPLTSDLAVWLLHLTAWVVECALGLINLAASLPGISWQTFTPSYLEIILYFLLIALVLVRKEVKPIGVVTWAVLLILLCDIFFWTHIRFFDPHLKVTALDVGQGSATLLELPRGKTMLIDGGGFSSNRRFDVGARILAPYLRRRKIATIDLIVLTHPNSDHLNGLLYILENFRVHKIVSNHESVDTGSYRQFLELVCIHQIPHPDFKALKRRLQVNDVTLELLHPPADFRQLKKRESWRNANNNSIVLKIYYKNHSLLFPGDLMHPAEATLLNRFPVEKLRSDILFAPHHGSKSSNSPALIKAVSPDITVIACGWRNPFGFPHEAVLSRYRSIETRILRTDQCGAVQLGLDGEMVRIDTMLPCRNIRSD